MKRYALFVFDLNEPNGGWDDFRGFFDDVEAAKQVGFQHEDQCNLDFHIVDLTVGAIVAHSESYIPSDPDDFNSNDDLGDED